MGSFTPPSIGQPNSTEDSKVATALTVLDNLLDSGDQIPTVGITDSAVTSAKIADGTIATGDLAANAVTAAKIGALPACRAYNSANISIANTTETRITLDSERFDTDTIHSTSVNTARLTATTAGVYQITGNANFAAPAVFAGNVFGRLLIYLNGATLIATQGTFLSSTTIPGYLSVSTVYKLAASDYVELFAWHNTGGALNIEHNANYSPEFGMAWMGTG